MVVVVGGPGESSRGKLMDMAALREAIAEGLEPTAAAGDSGQAVRIEDVFSGYDTRGELPVLFVDDVDGDETLTMYLYALPPCQGR